MSNTTHISIERLDVGSLIYVRDRFNAAAEVLDIDFDGIDTYSITFGTDDWSDVTSVKAGETVEAYDHQTFLRADKDISFEEWQAKNEAIGYDIDCKLVELNRLQGHVCRPLPETVLVDAVADALGVPAMAAE